MAGFDKRVFSNRLAALRNDRGWSQGDLARESGVSLNAIARYEAETDNIHRHHKCRVKAAVKPAQLHIIIHFGDGVAA